MKKVYQIRQEDFDRILQNARENYFKNQIEKIADKDFQLGFVSALVSIQTYMITVSFEEENK